MFHATCMGSCTRINMCRRGCRNVLCDPCLDRFPTCRQPNCTAVIFQEDAETNTVVSGVTMFSGVTSALSGSIGGNLAPAAVKARPPPPPWEPAPPAAKAAPATWVSQQSVGVPSPPSVGVLAPPVRRTTSPFSAPETGPSEGLQRHRSDEQRVAYNEELSRKLANVLRNGRDDINMRPDGLVRLDDLCHALKAVIDDVQEVVQKSSRGANARYESFHHPQFGTYIRATGKHRWQHINLDRTRIPIQECLNKWPPAEPPRQPQPRERELPQNSLTATNLAAATSAQLAGPPPAPVAAHLGDTARLDILQEELLRLREQVENYQRTERVNREAYEEQSRFVQELQRQSERQQGRIQELEAQASRPLSRCASDPALSAAPVPQPARPAVAPAVLERALLVASAAAAPQGGIGVITRDYNGRREENGIVAMAGDIVLKAVSAEAWPGWIYVYVATRAQGDTQGYLPEEYFRRH